MTPPQSVRRLDVWLRNHLPAARGLVWLSIGAAGLGFLLAVVKVVQRWRAGVDLLSPGLGKLLLQSTAMALLLAGLGLGFEFGVRWLERGRSIAVVGAMTGLGVAAAAIVTTAVRGVPSSQRHRSFWWLSPLLSSSLHCSRCMIGWQDICGGLRLTLTATIVTNGPPNKPMYLSGPGTNL